MKIFSFLNFLDLQGKFTQSDRLLSKISIATIDPLKVLVAPIIADVRNITSVFYIKNTNINYDFKLQHSSF